MGLVERIKENIEENFSKYISDVVLGSGIGLTYSATVTGQYLWIPAGVLSVFAGGATRILCGYVEDYFNQLENFEPNIN